MGSKILYITQCGFMRHSAETVHALEIIQCFKKQGHELHVIHPGVHGVLEKLGVKESGPRLRDNIINKALFQAWLFFNLFPATEKVDLIYVRQSALMVSPSILAIIRKIKMFAEFNTIFSHAETVKKFRFSGLIVSFIEKFTIKAATKIILVSDHLGKELKMLYPGSTHKIIIAENGANLELMRPLSKDTSRKEHKIPSKDFIVGFVGHLHPWQGLDCLLTALRDMKEECVSLIIVGSGKDLNYYISLSNALGISDRVTFLGSIPYEAVPSMIACFDVCVAPGTAEKLFNYEIRSPLKIYEYLSCGKPVIAGKLSCLEKYFSQNEIGYLIDPGNVEQLKFFIKKFLSDKQLVNRCGDNARRLAEKNLSWDITSKKILHQL